MKKNASERNFAFKKLNKCKSKPADLSWFLPGEELDGDLRSGILESKFESDEEVKQKRDQAYKNKVNYN